MPDSMNYVDWLEKARNDLLAAEAIMAYYESPPTDTVCYHCQQVAEKCLKAFLIAKAKKLLKIHDLIDLLEKCTKIDTSCETIRDQIDSLDGFYIESKYPPDIPTVIPIDETKSAVVNAREIYKFFCEKLEYVPN